MNKLSIASIIHELEMTTSQIENLPNSIKKEIALIKIDELKSIIKMINDEGVNND